MATPTIIIGIGTSGLEVLKHVQRFHYESTGKNKPDHVEYIYIETCIDSEVGITPAQNEIKSIYLSLKNLRTQCKYIKDDLGATWVPPLEDMLNHEFGAGGARPRGRVGLWGKNQEQKNYIKVKESIKSAWEDVKSHIKQGVNDSDPAVFIVGSFTGGTGSGIFIDLAYMVRNVIKNIGELYGLFLLPPIPDDMEENAQYYANTYGALKDLEHYSNKHNHYKENLPGGDSVDIVSAPFDLVHFISQNHIIGAPAIKTLDGLYKITGLNLFLNIIGVKEHRTKRLVDSPASLYCTFGLSGIQYPKDQIEEHLACSLSKELIQRWNDDKHYLIQGNQHEIDRNEISLRVGEDWDNLVNNAFEILDSIQLGDELAQKELRKIAIRINKNEIPDYGRFLFEKFTSKSSKNFYIAVGDNISKAVNLLIDGIADLNTSLLDETENIHYAKRALEYLELHIKETLGYWKSIGLSSNPSDWDVLLETHIRSIQKNEYKLVLEEDNILHDKLVNLYELLKMHLLGSKLVEIKNNIAGKDVPIMSTSQSPKKLPQTYYYTSLSLAFTRIINDKATLSFTKRQEEINSDIEDTTIPILRVFQYESFQKEIENALTLYKRSPNSNVSKGDVMENESLWKYLTNQDSHFLQARLYKDCISKYRKIIEVKRCVSDYNVSSYIEQNLKDSVRIAKKATNVFLSIKDGYTLDAAHFLPRFVAGDSRASIDRILSLFERDDINYKDFDRSKTKTILEIPSLKNLIVFYDEKSDLLPLEMISYADQMKKVYDNKPSYVKSMTDEDWKIRTRAYVPEFNNTNQ